MIDDEYGKRIAELNSNVKCISLKNEDADYFCTSQSINSFGLAGTLAWDSETLDFESKLIGSFNLENLILAISIAIELNISAQSIAKGIENCTNIDGRLHLVENQKNQMIFLDYAHSPDAYFRTLKALEENFCRPLKVLFGAGGGRDKSKRPKMAEVVEKYSIECYLAPDNPRFEDIELINNDVIKGFSNESHHIFNDRKEALIFALTNLKSDEILIIFGKGTEEYQEINGTKHFISHANIADFVIVFIATGEEETPKGKKKLITCFLVDRGTPGFQIKDGYNSVSHRGYQNCILTFDNCRLPSSKILGELHKGFDVANEWLYATRITVAAMCVGRARRVFNYALEWSSEREQFGQKIGKFQGVSFKLADMITKIDAADFLTLNSAWRLDNNLSANREVAQAKLYASEMLAEVTDQTIQIYGGMGLMDDLPLERFWRDARVERIYDGTSEIQRHIISRDLLRPLGA